MGPDTLTGLCKRIVPCLDVRGGRTVKGRNFVDIRDAGDPVELALRYSEEGADELVLLDIDATTDDRGPILSLVGRVARALSIPFTVGGGVRTDDDVRRLLGAGADKVAVNSAAVADPGLVDRLAAAFGSQCVVVALDVIREDGGAWTVRTHSGSRAVPLGAVDWAAEAAARGAGELLVTSIEHDGVKEGYPVELFSEITGRVGVPVIASGGMGHPDHAVRVLLGGGADAVLAASIFHYGEWTVGALKSHLRSCGVAVRP